MSSFPTTVTLSPVDRGNSDHDPVDNDLFQWPLHYVSKLKEMVVKLRENAVFIPPLTINNQPLEVFQSLADPWHISLDATCKRFIAENVLFLFHWICAYLSFGELVRAPESPRTT